MRARLACYRALATARRSSLRRLRSVPAGRVLVVCYGNIYRSAFVGASFRQRPVHGIEVRAVGLHPVPGRTAPERHIAMCERVGIDLRGHRSAVLTADDIRWADLVVVMDRHNWQALVERGVDRERVVWLGALSSGSVEIPDPYDRDDAEARRIVDRLSECCNRLSALLAAGRAGIR